MKNLKYVFWIYLMLLTCSVSYAISATTDKKATVPPKPVECIASESAAETMLNSHDALVKNEWGKYASFVNRTELEIFKEINLDLLNAVSPELDAMVLYGVVITKTGLAKTSPEEAFKINMGKFLVKQQPLNAFLYLDSFTVLDTIQSFDKKSIFLIREYYSSSDEMLTSDVPIEANKIDDCWKISFHPMIASWMKFTDEFIKSGKPISDK